MTQSGHSAAQTGLLSVRRRPRSPADLPAARSMAALLRGAFFNECLDAGVEVLAAVTGTHQIVAVR